MPVIGQFIEGEKSQRTYKLNRNTTVVVKSELKADIYKHTIQLTIEQASLEPLRFPDKAAITKLIEDADLDDEQTNLFADGGLDD